jgi:hypothetical protein
MYTWHEGLISGIPHVNSMGSPPLKRGTLCVSKFLRLLKGIIELELLIQKQSSHIV